MRVEHERMWRRARELRERAEEACTPDIPELAGYVEVLLAELYPAPSASAGANRSGDPL